MLGFIPSILYTDQQEFSPSGKSEGVPEENGELQKKENIFN